LGNFVSCENKNLVLIVLILKIIII